MDIRMIIAHLREELALLDEAIIRFENLTHHHTPRRGRPPSRLKATDVSEPRKRDGLNGSANRRSSPADPSPG